MFANSRIALNHYQRLGVGFRASQADIKGAYRALAKKYHPDQNPNNPEAEKKFREVKEAYECLSNKLKRSEYDRDWIQSGRPPWNPSKSTRSNDGDSADQAEEESHTLSRSQLIFVYGFVFVLPLSVSLLRKNPEASKASRLDERQIVSWGTPIDLPEASPRDELVRAFYNPLTHRWERLEDTADPPSPFELFRFFVKDRPGTYTNILRTVCNSTSVTQ